MSFLLIAGSPTQPSRSATLLKEAARQLARAQHHVTQLDIRALDSQALVLADFSHPSIIRATQQLEQAKGVIIATPIYKAAYSGLLKIFLDLLPQTALRGKSVLPLATGGSPHHMLALDYALRPVLHALGANDILPGVYATDAQITRLPEGGYMLAPDLATRLSSAIDSLQSSVLPATGSFASVAFHEVQLST